jgi:hypothetical protein
MRGARMDEFRGEAVVEWIGSVDAGGGSVLVSGARMPIRVFSRRRSTVLSESRLLAAAVARAVCRRFLEHAESHVDYVGRVWLRVALAERESCEVAGALDIEIRVVQPVPTPLHALAFEAARTHSLAPLLADLDVRVRLEGVPTAVGAARFGAAPSW